MRAALTLARRGLGRVAPNPSVGAILVREGRVLGRGVTTDGGRPHAEAVALAQAIRLWGREALAGATAYVTLEPCSHHGLTPPCSDALIDVRVARVVSPILDPDPRVAGRGFAKLEAAGVRVETGLMAVEARAVNAGFLSRLERGRPWLTLKLATTLDGRIATRERESRWITAAPARARVHLMRAETDAVMVGAATAIADDPMLDVRGLGLAARSPVRVVVDPALGLPARSRLVASARRVPVWLLHGAGAERSRAVALEAAGAQLLPVRATDRGIDLEAALGRLAEEGITRLLVEGGGRLSAGLLAAGLVDEIALFQAGTAIGGDGVAAVGPMGLGQLADAPRFERTEHGPIGPDTLTVWRRAGA